MRFSSSATKETASASVLWFNQQLSVQEVFKVTVSDRPTSFSVGDESRDHSTGELGCALCV